MTKKLQTIRSKEEGFTLVELLVVVVIIAVLATLAIVLLGDRSEGAKDAAAESNLQAAFRVASLSISDNGELPPVSATENNAAKESALVTAIENSTSIPNVSAGTGTADDTLYVDVTGDKDVTMTYKPQGGTQDTLTITNGSLVR